MSPLTGCLMQHPVRHVPNTARYCRSDQCSKGLAIVWPTTSYHYVPNQAVLTNSEFTNMRYLIDHRAANATAHYTVLNLCNKAI